MSTETTTTTAIKSNLDTLKFSAQWHEGGRNWRQLCEIAFSFD